MTLTRSDFVGDAEEDGYSPLDAFDEGEGESADGMVRNPYEKAVTPRCWAAYEAGVMAWRPTSPNWEAQAAYDDRWGARS